MDIKLSKEGRSDLLVVVLLIAIVSVAVVSVHKNSSKSYNPGSIAQGHDAADNF